MGRALGIKTVVVLGALMVGWPATAGAGGHELFAGLIPGEPLPDAELELYSGKFLGIEISGDQVIFNGQPLNFSNAPTANIGETGGILQFMQLTGDQNTVNFNVNMTVNIGTVTINDPVGSTISDIAVGVNISDGIAASINP